MPNRKWNIGIAVLFVIFSCILISFLFSTLRIRELLQPILANEASKKAPYHVVLISQELDNPYWRSIEQGATEAASKYEMQLEYTGPVRINPNEQIKLLEKAIAAKADALLVQGINDPQFVDLINQAVSRHIPVITIDTDEPSSRRLSYVGTNNLAAGKIMGGLVADAAAQKGQVAVLIGNEQAPNQQLRLEGLRSVIAKFPELTLVEVRSSNISRLQAVGEAEELLHKYPQLDYMVGLSALDGIGIAEAAERTKDSGLQIFAFDALEETLARIRSGEIKATIVQQPYNMGYDAISLLNDFLHGAELPEQHFTKMTVQRSQTLNPATGETSR
ncbi:substrate-binding domain-containing protein [Bacillus sp. FJAT-26390]|uniref:substrate-binding domain-containing protein n=1 Tax=Bacillus sp. FJAT-26390 TaxID=1743142 RepID=UPI000807D40C|nr:substrate-binding domain-containing protein [Bacillus sp. FJAT-26390]OBZ16634.1 LacI family transcriptional regulator [Bacillus sp. FJAT-26390]